MDTENTNFHKAGEKTKNPSLPFSCFKCITRFANVFCLKVNNRVCL
jgi:hypothetical protein